MDKSSPAQRSSWTVSSGIWIFAGACLVLVIVLRVLHALGLIH